MAAVEGLVGAARSTPQNLGLQIFKTLASLELKLLAEASVLKNAKKKSPKWLGDPLFIPDLKFSRKLISLQASKRCQVPFCK